MFIKRNRFSFHAPDTFECNFSFSHFSQSQLNDQTQTVRIPTLTADTYSRLNMILGGTAYEVPDRIHPIQHITQQTD